MERRHHFSTKRLCSLAFALFAVSAVQAQTGRVRGIVRDEAGKVLPYVNVLAKNQATSLTSGAQTDSAGVFVFPRLPVEGKYAFVVSMVGYETQTLSGYTLKANESTSILVKLKTSLSALNEVVVVGYGTRRKSDITGSVAVVGEKDLTQGVNNNAMQALNGKAAGVYVSQSSSAPGGGVSIRVRGAGSINSSNAVLVVVDGMPGVDPSSISQDDIASIQVLKDASAAAIYGSRAANGVVLITTKRGAAGQLNVSYNGYVGVQQLAKKIRLLTAPEYMKVLNEMSAAQGQPEPFSQRYRDSIGAGTDWQDEIFQTAIAHSHQLSFNGGAKTNKYYVGVNYLNQDGILKNTGYERYNARVNYELTPSEQFDVSLALNVSRAVGNQPYNQTGINENAGAINTALNFDPTISPLPDANGRYRQNPLIALENPLAIIYGITQKSTVTNTYGMLTGNYRPVKGLTITARAGADLSNSRRDYYNSRITQFGSSAGGIGSITHNDDTHWLAELLAKYDKRIGHHNLSVLLGTTAERYDFSSAEAASRNFLSDITSTHLLNSGDGINGDNVSSQRTSNKLHSYLGRVNYEYMDKYLFTASFRSDGTSRFSDANKYALFPAVALGWNMHKEPFLQNAKGISNLKLRLGYGQIGNQAIGNFATLQTYQAGRRAVFGDNLYQGVEPARLPNTALRWETTEEYNAGIDFGFLEGRVSGSLEYYAKNAKDQLFSKPVPAFTGFSQQVVNFGNVRNKGVDVQLNTRNIAGKDFGWETNITASYLHNEVTRLPDFIPQLLTGAFSFVPNYALVQTGMPIYSYFGYAVDGVFQTDQEAASSGQPGAKAGSPRFKDQDGSKTITPKDRVVLGSPLPKFTWGFANTFTYKGLSLNVLLLGVHDAYALDANVIESIYPINFQRNHMAEYYLDRWTPQNPGAKYPSGINASTYGGQFSVNSYTVRDVSFVRLKTLTLGYTLPFTGKALKSIHAYLAADNLFTITGYNGYDPDANSRESIARVAQNSYPLAKVYRLGAKLNF